MQKNTINTSQQSQNLGNQPYLLSEMKKDLNKRLESENLPIMELQMKTPRSKPDNMIEATFLKNTKK